jgi:ubiquinone/menaquinone biosynthesis C-methylase UbiE
LEHARARCRRPDFRFLATDGERIPVEDDWADYVCFFSVMTHITHEETWRYILESKRVLKPGGHLVCSFLEFRIRSHWWIFKNTYADRSPDKILNQFLSRDALEAFAFNAALDVVSFHDGDQPLIPIEGEIVWENGVRMRDRANLGQSWCVLRKPVEPRDPPA